MGSLEFVFTLYIKYYQNSYHQIVCLSYFKGQSHPLLILEDLVKIHDKFIKTKLDKSKNQKIYHKINFT